LTRFSTAIFVFEGLGAQQNLSKKENLILRARRRVFVRLNAKNSGFAFMQEK
jgi:hypothetical protein